MDEENQVHLSAVRVDYNGFNGQVNRVTVRNVATVDHTDAGDLVLMKADGKIAALFARGMWSLVVSVPNTEAA